MSRVDGRLKSVLQRIEKEDVDSCEDKLRVICDMFEITAEQLDATIAANPEVLRTVVGHSAESVLDEIFLAMGADVVPAGGDSNIDRNINCREVQIKTPYRNGTNISKGEVSFKCHKTHGAKSEREGPEYYELAKGYPELIIGLISIQPMRILFLKNDEIPRHELYTDRLKSPFKCSFDNHIGLNNFGRLGLSNPSDVSSILIEKVPSFLRESARIVGERLGIGGSVKPRIILETILKPENFRIWDMSIRGFLRETVFSGQLVRFNSCIHDPRLLKRKRWNKTDGLLLNAQNQSKYIQMKGLSVNTCDFEAGVVGVEVQLSRGRINDHETQSRMYLKSTPDFNKALGPDFDFLILVIDPPLVSMLPGVGKQEWRFYCIPIEDLVSHPNYSHRVKPVQKFSMQALERYRITDKWFSRWTGTLW